jgi:hypothetical protein
MNLEKVFFSAAPPGLALLLARGNEDILISDDDTLLQPGDHLLFCARHDGAARMNWILRNDNVLDYVLTGEERPDGYFWRWLSRWRQAPACPLPSSPSRKATSR